MYLTGKHFLLSSVRNINQGQETETRNKYKNKKDMFASEKEMSLFQFISKRLRSGTRYSFCLCGKSLCAKLNVRHLFIHSHENQVIFMRNEHSIWKRGKQQLGSGGKACIWAKWPIRPSDELLIFIGAETLLFYSLVHEAVSKNNNSVFHNEIINQSSLYSAVSPKFTDSLVLVITYVSFSIRYQGKLVMVLVQIHIILCNSCIQLCKNYNTRS